MNKLPIHLFMFSLSQYTVSSYYVLSTMLVSETRVLEKK